MVGALLLVAAITLAPPAESATVFANRTAFTEACTGTANTLPDQLARQARTALAALGWEVGGAVGPGFTRRAAVAGAASAAFYVHSHGDLYWDTKSDARVGGFRADAGLCLGAPILLPSEIAAMRRGVPPASLVYISSCHNGERASRLPGAFGIAHGGCEQHLAPKAGAVVHMPTDEQVLQHRGVFKQLDVLKRAGNAQGSDGMRRHIAQTLAQEIQMAGRWCIDAADQVEHRGFACAVGADEREHLALAHIEAHAIDRQHAAKANG